ncbi:uncharacterized protein LOC125756161 [Rhipicephalus sanguineus]|uniref:uncharacterized protein LOC125756161 n=1 Tax=Rhipicephalus sanguineus TaxID=34632 RepID=UPI0020C4FD85|nr:uncharacterized protein LOC125756161 [Rhipicephalus sanguineus]
MCVRLTPDQGIDSLVHQIEKFETPLDVVELDLTNCIHLDTDEVIPIIKECQSTDSLRCLSCSIRPGALVTLILGHMHHLVRLELTLVCETAEEVGEYPDKHEMANRYILPDLRSIYVEMAYDASFLLFDKILRESLNLEDLHVHFLRGSFENALVACKVLCEQAIRLEKFTFTSEQPPYCQQLSSPLELFNCMSVCANVEYRKLSGFMSFFALHDLAEDCCKMRCMPNQTTLAAVHTEGKTLAAETMRAAFRGHNWSWINRVCFVLLPEDPSSLVYPQAGLAYRDSLLFFFASTFRYILELNISSFHFAPDLDVKELLQDATLAKLRYLRSLSATPCGLRRLSALRLLAQHCQDFTELDVRYEKKGGVVRCAGCEADVPLDPDAPTRVPGGSVGFRNRLVRLTVCGVRFPVGLHFIECSGPTTMVRLSGCSDLSNQHCTHLAKLLSERSAPICLVLRHGCLQIHDASMVANLSSVQSLLYLYLLSTVAYPDEVAESCFLALRTTLNRLRYLHFHYLSLNGVDRSLTWLRSEDDPQDGGELLRNAPCFQCCSTATFIGLAKPMNREFVPHAQAKPR